VGRQLSLQARTSCLASLFLITNIGEEIGWRGYALPHLLRRFNSLVSSLIIGVCWAAFHWFALAQNPTQRWGYVAVGSVSLIAMSIVMTWVFNRTGSVMLTVLLHATYDVVAIGVIPLAGTGLPLLAFALTTAVVSLAAVLLIVVTGPELGRLSDVGAQK
jgi:membrane protease YdiL (CAAX protease family)